jgi:hypothetical protein
MESPCLSCTFCAKNHPGRKIPSSLCTPWMHRPLDPRNPPEYRWEKAPFRLYGILRAITPKALWKGFLKAVNPHGLGGYREETHKRVRLEDCPPAKSTRLSTPTPPWHQVRRGVTPQEDLHTPPPRITTIAHHGPRSLLHSFFPESPRVPKATLSAIKVKEMVMAERASRLAGTRNLALGGHGSTIPELEALKAPEVSESMEDLEPLRAMSLKEVTNLPFLREYTAYASEDSEDE